MKQAAKIILLLVTIGLYTHASAKEDIDLARATYYYKHMAFHDAIPYYEKVAAAGGGTSQVCSRLGDCYRLTGNIPKAAHWYGKTLTRWSYNEIVMLRYGQMLMELSRYDEAGKWLKQYWDNNDNDRRAANLITSCTSAAAKLTAAAKGPQPVLLDFNTDRSEIAPTLWNGNLVFASDTAIKTRKKKSKWSGSSCYGIYTVAADASGNCSNAIIPGPVKHMSAAWHGGPCTFDKDGSEMYFTRTRYKSRLLGKKSLKNEDTIVVLEIMVASGYNSSKQQYTKLKPFAYNNGNYSVAHPAISPNGKTLAFSSDMLGRGSDLYICTKNAKGKWSPPQRLGPNINTEGEEVFPYFANDTTLFFASDGHIGLGGLDIYVTHWQKKQKTFSDPINVGAPINSPYDDISMALSVDGTSGYFSSNRPARKGGDNIYFYKR